mmetsp:Transcript_44299/g.139131  ORF Transcript_44299/g.139131 Transcript_44299/m.139131 type:complete len:219 (-) Transcript_44299:2642-3298(-)
MTRRSPPEVAREVGEHFASVLDIVSMSFDVNERRDICALPFICAPPFDGGDFAGSAAGAMRPPLVAFTRSSGTMSEPRRCTDLIKPRCRAAASLSSPWAFFIGAGNTESCVAKPEPRCAFSSMALIKPSSLFRGPLERDISKPGGTAKDPCCDWEFPRDPIRCQMRPLWLGDRLPEKRPPPAMLACVVLPEVSLPMAIGDGATLSDARRLCVWPRVRR